MKTPSTQDPSWRSVFGADDREALERYARVRPPFEGSSAVLIVIDVTEAFVGPNEPVLVSQRTSRQACGERAWRALPAISQLIDRFRTNGLPIVFTVPDSAQSWVGAATRGDSAELTSGGSLSARSSLLTMSSPSRRRRQAHSSGRHC